MSEYKKPKKIICDEDGNIIDVEDEDKKYSTGCLGAVFTFVFIALISCGRHEDNQQVLVQQNKPPAVEHQLKTENIDTKSEEKINQEKVNEQKFRESFERLIKIAVKADEQTNNLVAGPLQNRLNDILPGYNLYEYCMVAYYLSNRCRQPNSQDDVESVIQEAIQMVYKY